MAKAYTYWLNTNKAVPSWAEFWPSKESILTKTRPTTQEFYQEACDEIQISRERGDNDNSTVWDALRVMFYDNTEFSTEVEVEIYRGTRSGTLYFAGYFSVSDATLDDEKKIFKITPRIDDSYRSILEIRDADFDAHGEAIGEDVILGIPQTIGAWNAGSPGATYADFDTFTVGANNGILTSVIDSNAGAKEGKYVSLGVLSTSDVVFIDISAFTKNSGDSPFFDIVSVVDGSVTTEGATVIIPLVPEIISFHITAPGEAFLLIFTDPVTDVTNFTMTFTLDISDEVNSLSGSLIMDFVEDFITDAQLMGLTGFAGKVKSTFLANDAFPSDAPGTLVTWITANANGNYVSLDVDNPLNEFIISETRRWVTSDVTENKISFTELMDTFRQVLNAGWYIDADGDFRIEHVEYFELMVSESTAVDLTGAAYAKYKIEVDAKELIFNKALLANREQFAWQQVDTIANSEDFVGVDIIYENLETIENAMQHQASMITTDIIYLNDNAASAAANGFCFFQCYVDGGDYVIEKEVGILSTDNIRNNHFSWANLQDKYWTWRRMSENGDMNDGDTVAFDSAVKFLEQPRIKFGYLTTLSGFTKITTSQGTGQQAETVRDLDTDFLTMLIRFNPYA